MTPIDQFEEFGIDAAHLKRKIRLGASLPLQLQRQILEVVAEFSYVFAWSPTNLGIIPRSFMRHKLGIPSSAKPVTQKRGSFNTEKQAILQNKITDLLQEDFIQRVQFPQWLANPIVVPKPGRK